MKKVTQKVYSYKKGFEPNYIIPSEYCPYRFALGKLGDDPLVAICMNPSAAKETAADSTINRIIILSQKLNKDGWIVFNLYPERATDAGLLDAYNHDLATENIKTIREFLSANSIKEVWGAWGNDYGIESLKKGKQLLKSMLLEQEVKVFYFGTLTKDGNPRHPLQRYEKWDITKKQYLKI